MGRRYLLATDGTESSEGAEDYVRRFLSPEETTIHLLSVIDLFDESKIREFSLGVSAEKLQERHEERTLEMLQPRARKLGEEGFRAEIEVVHGRPGHEICRRADELDVDGIFIGRGRHGRLGEMFQGSVSRYVVMNSTRSVIVTPEFQNKF